VITNSSLLSIYGAEKMRSKDQQLFLDLSLLFLISSSLRPFCRPACFPSGRPGSPWRCGWLRCSGRRRAGSPRRSEGTLGPASHRSRLPPVQLQWRIQSIRTDDKGPIIIILSNPNIYSSQRCHTSESYYLSILQLPSALGVGTPASAAEAAAALRASSSCLCRCSSIDTRPAQDQHWDPHQIQSHWHQDPSWSLLHQPGWERRAAHQPDWDPEGP
uniref:Uncharacterized protein n=1 Tax=Sparus aurata TaxID=8175 RepID=A0A671VUC5_SPAAU